jgi:hypothetical protein
MFVGLYGSLRRRAISKRVSRRCLRFVWGATFRPFRPQVVGCHYARRRIRAAVVVAEESYPSRGLEGCGGVGCCGLPRGRLGRAELPHPVAALQRHEPGRHFLQHRAVFGALSCRAPGNTSPTRYCSSRSTWPTPATATGTTKRRRTGRSSTCRRGTGPGWPNTTATPIRRPRPAVPALRSGTLPAGCGCSSPTAAMTAQL